MKYLLPQHKVLLTICAVFIAAGVGLHFYLVRPLKLKVNGMVDRVMNESRTIRGNGWSTDERQLMHLKADKTRELERLENNSRDVWQIVADTFKGRLDYYEGDEQMFMNQVTRLDYEDAYSGILRELERDGRLRFDPAVLRLSQDSVSPYVYQLVLQLWTLEEIMKLAMAHGVIPIRQTIEVPVFLPDGTPALDPQTGADRTTRRTVSQVVLPGLVPYLLTEDDELPYLLEIPLLFKARCTPRALHDFMARLADFDNGRFLTLNRLEIHRLPPDDNRRRELLEVQMEVAAFMRLRDDLRIRRRERAQPLPRGA